MDDPTDLQHSESHLPVSTGVEHWEEQRRRWTKGFTDTPSSEDSSDSFVKKLKFCPRNKLVQLYNTIINTEKPFRRRIPLTQLIRILVAGWKHTGLWPSEEELRTEILQKHLNPDDYNLQLHLSSVLDSDAPLEDTVDSAVSEENCAEPKE